MSANPLFFTFSDGVLKYDCNACRDKPCCHGGGINLSASGRGAALLREYPAMQLEVQPQAGNMLYAPILPSGCRFANGDKCLLYQKENFPAYCQLYPFTLLAVVGETLVIGPDPRCPGTAVLDNSGVTHKQLTQLVESLEPCVIPVAANRESADLAKELLIRDTACDCLKNGDSLGSLLAFIHVVDHHSGEELSTIDIDGEMAGFAQKIESILPQWLELIGLGKTPENPEPVLEQLLIAHLSTQRIFGRWEDAATFAMAYAGLGSYLFRLPSVLQKRATPLDVCQYFSSLEPLIWHLVHWLDKPQYQGTLAERWSGVSEAVTWGTFLKSREQLLPAATMVELRLIYEDLREGLSWI